MAKKKQPVLRKAFTFKGVDFYEDPCKCSAVLYSYSGGKGKDGPLSRTVIVGPADMIRNIKSALRKA